MRFCAGGDPKSFQAAQKMAGAISGDGDKYQGPPAGPMIAGTGTMIVEGNKMSAQGFARATCSNFRHFQCFSGVKWSQRIEPESYTSQNFGRTGHVCQHCSQRLSPCVQQI